MNTPVCCLAIVISGSIFSTASAQDPCGERKRSLRKVATNDHYSWFTINKIFNWYGNNGNSSYNRVKSNSGLEYPADAERRRPAGRHKTAELGETDGFEGVGYPHRDELPHDERFV